MKFLSAIMQNSKPSVPLLLIGALLECEIVSVDLAAKLSLPLLVLHSHPDRSAVGYG